MSIVNQDSITKFQNLLLSNEKAKMCGTTLVINQQPESIYQRCWLYDFLQQTEKRNVPDMVLDQMHYNTLMQRVAREFRKGVSLSRGGHLVRTLPSKTPSLDA